MPERCWIVPDVRDAVEAYIRVEEFLKETKQRPLNDDYVFYLEIATLPQLVDES